ncbi:Aspartate aminotransferase [Chlamydiales bacterium SCGC AG-110-P3]|nr:Aspartate aminotransferase [Chlamydiales bacterium SCGC AG-110-P3]
MALDMPEVSSIEVPLDARILELGESATLVAKRVARERKASGDSLYDWGLGQSPFPVPDLLVSAVAAHANQAFYAPVEGILSLRQAIADRFTTANYPLVPDNILVASGLKQLLFDCQRAFGGRIIHVAPYWVSYADQTLLLGKKTDLIRTLEENDFKLTPAEIEALCAKDPGASWLLIFNHPVNPTGVSYTEGELKALADVLQKYRVVVFADEIYLGCHHHGKTHSISEYLPELTIRASSLSKEFSCGGYRLGWATFPDGLGALRKAMMVLGSNSYSCAPVPMQYGAIAALEGSIELDMLRSETQNILKSVGAAASQRFKAMNLRVTESDAAWYLLIGFEHYREALQARGIRTSAQLALALVEEVGTVFVPGEAFGLYPEQLQLRASYIDFNGRQALEEIRRDEELVEPLSENMKMGLDALHAWLREL